MNKIKKIGAALALTGFLLTGGLAGIGYAQARATTTTGVVTIRSIISGTLTGLTGTAISFPTVTATAKFLGPAGNCATAPAYAFTGDTTTGFCNPSANVVAMATAGTIQVRIGSAMLVKSAGTYCWSTQTSADSSNVDLCLSRSAAKTLTINDGSGGALTGVTVTGWGTLSAGTTTFASGNVSWVSTNGYVADLGGGSAFQIRDAGNSKTITLTPNGTSVFPLAVNFQSSIQNNGKVTISATAPTISSGFGSSPSVASNNGTAAFTINVGTGGIANNGVIGLPTATTGWVVTCVDQTTPGVNVTKQTANSTTSATVTNYNSTLGTAAAWAASDVLYCQATAF